MRRVALILLSITMVFGVDKDKAKFTVGAAVSYTGYQTLDKITIAAVPYLSDDQIKAAFGKAEPLRYGVLPVLVVMENGTGKALRLDLKAEFITADGRHVPALPPDDVTHIGASSKAPRIGGSSPIPLPLPTRAKKGPLNTWEIEGRAFAPKLVPPDEAASGFFYFYGDHMDGARLYLTGIKDAASGKDFFYFEVPVQKQ